MARALACHGAEITEPLVAIEHAQEPQEQARGAVLEQVDQNAVFLGGRKPAAMPGSAANRGFGFRTSRSSSASSSRTPVDGPLVLGRVDQGFGVAARDLGRVVA